MHEHHLVLLLLLLVLLLSLLLLLLLLLALLLAEYHLRVDMVIVVKGFLFDDGLPPRLLRHYIYKRRACSLCPPAVGV